MEEFRPESTAVTSGAREFVATGQPQKRYGRSGLAAPELFAQALPVRLDDTHVGTEG